MNSKAAIIGVVALVVIVAAVAVALGTGDDGGEKRTDYSYTVEDVHYIHFGDGTVECRADVTFDPPLDEGVLIMVYYGPTLLSSYTTTHDDVKKISFIIEPYDYELEDIREGMTLQFL